MPSPTNPSPIPNPRSSPARAPNPGPAPGVAPSEAELRHRLQGLQHAVDKGRGRVRRLAIIAIGLAVLLVVLVAALYVYRVTRYAEVREVEAVAAATGPGAEIRYEARSAGKVEFVRESEGLVETLTQYAQPDAAPAAEPAPGAKSAPPGGMTGRFQWSGRPGDKGTLKVTYRSGLALVTRDLPVADRPPAPTSTEARP